MSALESILDPVIAAKVIAVLTLLSAVKGLFSAFGNQDNKIVIFVQKVLDVLGFNPKH